MSQPLDSIAAGLIPSPDVAPPVAAASGRDVHEPALDNDRGTSHETTAPVDCVRTLHVINGEDYSGAERVQDLLALRLPEFGYEVGFACVKPDRFAQACEAQSVPLYEAPMRAKFDLRPAWTLARLIRRDQYRLVHTHSPRAALVGSLAARLARVPFVHHVHGQTAVGTVPRWHKWINTVTERASLAGVAAVIAVSDSAARYLKEQGIPEDKIRRVPNGVPSPPQLPFRPEPHGTWTLGTAAMFRPRKGAEVLLDAVALLRDQGHRVRLRMVGRFQFPWYEKQIRERTSRQNLDALVDWVGFTGDVNVELARMDVFILPSVLAEGLPMAVIEAMAAGVPVIGTRVPGTLDTVRHGEDGLLVEPGDAEALASAVAGLIEGRWNWSALRQRAYRQQVARFSDRSMAAGVAEIYRRILT